MNLTNFKDYLIRSYKSKKTHIQYYGIMKKFFNQYEEFNKENINKFLTDLCNENKFSAKNSSISAFNSYLKYLSENGEQINIKIDGYTTIDSPEKPSVNQDEIEKEILPYFPQLFTDYKKRAFVFRFLMLTMLRISEATNLKTCDIDFDKNRLQVVYGKGNKCRLVPFHKIIKADLQKYCQESTSEYALDVSNGYINNIFKKINTELGYKKHLTPHNLRRSGAKTLFKQTRDINALRKILGHKSVETTQIYIGYDNDDTQEVYNKMKYKKGVIE